MDRLKISRVEVFDIRFPTSLDLDGSDAMHKDPDYSCAYVTLHLDPSHLKGHGLAFTLGRGTQVVVEAVKAVAPLVEGQSCYDIWRDFGRFWRTLTSESQIRWIGPEKGALHLAVAAIVNAIWDLWAKKEGKPLWKLLVDLSPQHLVSTLDLRYLRDVISPEECVSMLKEKGSLLKARENEMVTKGFPAYTTQVGWLGYPDEKVIKLTKEFLKEGFTAFKVKVGTSVAEDKRRCALVRQAIGENNTLMIDANQVWEVPEAIDWVTQLKEFKPLWIEEPTSPDDILGHAEIAKALAPFGIGVATGEMCQNRVMFKQLFQARAISFCQIDACRLGGVNEVLAVYFLAKKFGVPVCPHAGGVGLCEMVQHLQVWDYVSLTGLKDDRMIEWVDHLHEHFLNPPIVTNGHYIAPLSSGYSTEMRAESIETFSYPNGKYWKSVLEK